MKKRSLFACILVLFMLTTFTAQAADASFRDIISEFLDSLMAILQGVLDALPAVLQNFFQAILDWLRALFGG